METGRQGFSDDEERPSRSGAMPTCPVAIPETKKSPTRLSQKDKRIRSDLLMIGIAEGGARTHDLEVDLFEMMPTTMCITVDGGHKSHTLYRLSYPGKGID